MQKKIFSKHSSETGFTFEEAAIEKDLLDKVHSVKTPTSKWNPAEIVDDERGGYKLILTTKP